MKQHFPVTGNLVYISGRIFSWKNWCNEDHLTRSFSLSFLCLVPCSSSCEHLLSLHVTQLSLTKGVSSLALDWNKSGFYLAAEQPWTYKPPSTRVSQKMSFFSTNKQKIGSCFLQSGLSFQWLAFLLFFSFFFSKNFPHGQIFKKHLEWKTSQSVQTL